MLKIPCFAKSQALRRMMRGETTRSVTTYVVFAISQLHLDAAEDSTLFAKSQALYRMMRGETTPCATTYVVLPYHSTDA